MLLNNLFSQRANAIKNIIQSYENQSKPSFNDLKIETFIKLRVLVNKKMEDLDSCSIEALSDGDYTDILKSLCLEISDQDQTILNNATFEMVYGHSCTSINIDPTEIVRALLTIQPMAKEWISNIEKNQGHLILDNFAPSHLPLLCEFIKSQPANLIALQLTGCPLDLEVAKALATSITTNTTLRELDLSRNNIGDAEVKFFAELLQNNNLLKKLTLNHNNIRDVGAQYLAEALKKNTDLMELNLAWNDIKDSGAEALANMLHINETLTQLNINLNSIGIAGEKAIANALEINTTLTKLLFQVNGADNQIKQIIKTNLELNPQYQASLINARAILTLFTQAPTMFIPNDIVNTLIKASDKSTVIKLAKS